MEVLIDWITDEEVNNDKSFGAKDTSNSKYITEDNDESKLSLCRRIAQKIQEEVGTLRTTHSVRSKIHDLVAKF